MAGLTPPRSAGSTRCSTGFAAQRPVRPIAATRRLSWRRFADLPLAAAAALVAVAIIAGGVGYGLGGGAPKPPEGWHEAVAEYWALTTEATLAPAPPADLAENQLALAGRALAVP